MYPCMNYKCSKCGVADVKLWRDYQTMLCNLDLYCMTCALKDQEKHLDDEHFSFAQGESDQIGWLVPAIPSELPVNGIVPKDESYWGYTSVPDWGIKWWYDLPPVIPHPHPESQRKMLTRVEEEARKIEERRMRDERTKQKIEETEFVVMCGGNDYHDMWLHWNTVLDLKQDGEGYWEEIGKLDKRPVAVTVFWYHIEGKRVAFVEGTSQVIDHQMIENWTEKTFPIFKQAKKKGDRYPSCNMANFHNCLGTIAPDWHKDPRKDAQYELIHKILTYRS